MKKLSNTEARLKKSNMASYLELLEFWKLSPNKISITLLTDIE